jgi:hypothetical protein
MEWQTKDVLKDEVDRMSTDHHNLLLCEPIKMRRIGSRVECIWRCISRALG